MKRNYFFAGLFSLLSVVVCSCDKNDDDKKNEVEEQKVEVIEKVKENEFRLYNQYSRDGFLFDVETQSVEVNLEADFDFAFIYADVDGLFDGVKYMFAGPSCEDLLDYFKRINYSYACRNRTEFYELPRNFSIMKFDTLSTVAGLRQVFDNSKRIYDKNTNTYDCIKSDSYGWADDYMFGVKTEKGKHCIVRLLKFSEYNDKEPGNVLIRIKYED